MPQMTKCPQCGADNSVRRETCYACGASLTGPAAKGPASTSSPASQRFAAVLGERGDAPRVPEASVPKAAPAPAGPPVTMPTFYGGIGQVRRAMVLFRQLHALVQAGIPLAQALADLQRHVAVGLKGPVRAMAQHVVDGGRLSDGMRPYRDIFLAYQVELVHAGELSGSLPQALDQIASDCEAEYKLRKAVALALLPVFFVTVVMLLVLPVALLLGGEAPRRWTAAELWTGYVRMLFRVSVPIGVGFVGVWAAWLAASRSRSFAVISHAMLLRVPIIGGAHRRIGVMRFLGSLSVLLNAGVPVVEAYRTAAAATGNHALARRLLRESDDLYAGRGLTDTLGRLRLASRIDVNQLAIGETSGKLPETLRRIAADYREHAERSAKFLPYLLQFAAYAVVAPLAVFLWWTLFRIYINLRLVAPFEHLFDVP